MDIVYPIKKNIIILALGAESAGNFSVFKNNQIFFSEDFGDLLEEENWQKFRNTVLKYLKNTKIKPEIILTDLHPLFRTTSWGQKLAKKYKAKFIQIQHHHAHLFSAIGDKLTQNTKYNLRDTIYGIAMDGTGFGIDEKIWGGEVFEINEQKIQRIGHLENQTLIGGDLAIREPARILISILNNFLNKEKIYRLVKKYYGKNQFELIYNQLQQNFNCLETSSTGRILDAVSILLGFCENTRKYKHEPIDLLEKNSTKPYVDLKPKITKDKNGIYILDTTNLFNYMINYLHKKDKKRLASTAQLYIAEGLYEIIKLKNKKQKTKEIFISGGLANNKIISDYLISQGAYAAKTVPRGDAGISFGQIISYILEQKK